MQDNFFPQPTHLVFGTRLELTFHSSFRSSGTDLFTLYVFLDKFPRRINYRMTLTPLFPRFGDVKLDK